MPQVQTENTINQTLGKCPVHHLDMGQTHTVGCSPRLSFEQTHRVQTVANVLLAANRLQRKPDTGRKRMRARVNKQHFRETVACAFWTPAPRECSLHLFQPAPRSVGQAQTPPSARKQVQCNSVTLFMSEMPSQSRHIWPQQRNGACAYSARTRAHCCTCSCGTLTQASCWEKRASVGSSTSQAVCFKLSSLLCCHGGWFTENGMIKKRKRKRPNGESLPKNDRDGEPSGHSQKKKKRIQMFEFGVKPKHVHLCSLSSKILNTKNLHNHV